MRGATAKPPAPLLRLHRHSLANVLVLGGLPDEREAVAGAFHRASPVRHGAFLRLDCARDEARLRHALQLWLMPDGAPPVANPLGESERGTLYLECLGSLSAPTQRLLLALACRIEDAAPGAAGGRGPARLAAGSPDDLADAVESGTFSGALYDWLDKIRVDLDRLPARGAA